MLLSPWGYGHVSKHHSIPAEAVQTYPHSLSSYRLAQGAFWDVEILTSLVSGSLKQKFLLASRRTIPKDRSDSPWTWICAKQTCTAGTHDKSGSSCRLRPREGGTRGMSSLVSRPVNHDRSAAAYDEIGLLGDFILHGWPAGMCFCLGSAALALIWGGRLLFCIRLQIVWHLLVCVVWSTICCISKLPSNHSS